jgi:hypothetical protein
MRHDGRAHLFPLLSAEGPTSCRASPRAPPPSTRPRRIPDPLTPFFSPGTAALKGVGCHRAALFPFSPLPPIPLRVNLVVAHYTPPHCLLSKPGH